MRKNGGLFETRGHVEKHGKKKGAPLPSLVPASIILGCAASGKFEENVIAYCKQSRVNLFKMEKDATEYRLHKRPILEFENDKKANS